MDTILPLIQDEESYCSETLARLGGEDEDDEDDEEDREGGEMGDFSRSTSPQLPILIRVSVYVAVFPTWGCIRAN